jgi:hypothetical protein
VQIYSLSKGYHRHLTLTGLPAGRWQAVTVDLTQARREDGTGGPLAEGERIDDIQFYTDRRAELWIDDVVLHEAGRVGEKEPFPKRILFTGWFDTGRQGKEWPGRFAIVSHTPPERGNYARSVSDPIRRKPVLYVHLRGGRPVGAATCLRFRYRAVKAERVKVELHNATAKVSHVLDWKPARQGAWDEVTLDFGRAVRSDGMAGGLRPGDRVDEVRFLLPTGGELGVDDLLLYEPGER